MTTKDFDINIQGLTEVQSLLKGLPDDVTDKIQLDINKKGAQFVVKEMQKNAPSGNNDKKAKSKIENNIVSVKGEDPTSVWVGIKKKIFYAGFLSEGTKERTVKGRGKYPKGTNRGKIAASNWIEKSHADGAANAVEFLQQNYLKLINQSVKKQLKGFLK